MLNKLRQFRDFYTFYFIAIILIILGVIVVLKIKEYNFRIQIQKEFKYTAQNKAVEIEHWFENELNAVSFFQQTTFFARGLNDYINNPYNKDLKTKIFERLKAANLNRKYENIIFTDCNGKIYVNFNPNDSILNDSTYIMIKKACQSGKIAMSYYNNSSNLPFLEFVVPISRPYENAFACLIFKISLDKHFSPILLRWPILTQQPDLYMFWPYKGHFNILGFHHNTLAAQIKQPIKIEIESMNNLNKIIEGFDRDNQEVLAITQTIKGTPLFFFLTIKQKELFKPVKVQNYIILVLGIIAIGVVTLFFYIISIEQSKILLNNTLKEERIWNNKLKSYRTILYSIGDAVITTDKLGNITMMNRVAECLTEYTENESIGKPLTDIFKIANEYTLQPVETPIEKVIREKRIVGLANHTVLINRSGKIIPIIDSGAPVIDDNGKIQGVVLVFRDQTKEKIKDAKLKKIQEELHLLFETVPNGIVLLEIEYNENLLPTNLNIFNINKRLKEMLEIKEEKFNKHLMFDKLAISEEEFLNIFIKLTQNKKNIEFEHFSPILNKFFKVTYFLTEPTIMAIIFEDISEKKLLEKERYRLLNILENSKNEIFIFDYYDWHFEYVNNEALKQIGYTNEELKQLNFTKIATNLTEEKFKNILQPLITKEKNIVNFECDIKRKDGTQYPAEGQIQLNEETHKVFLAILNDISEKKKIEKKLAAAEQKYTQLFNSITEAIFIHKPDTGEIIDCNDAVLKLYQFDDKEEIIKYCNIGSISDVSGGFTQEKALEKLHKAYVEGTQQFEWKARKKNGEVFWLNIIVKKVKVDNQEFLLASGRDITLEKEIREALNESNERFRLAFETSPDSININRLEDGVYLDVNEGFCNITGYTKEEVIGKSSLEINIWVNPEDRARLVKELKEKGTCANLEAQFRCKNGKIVTGLMSARIIMLKGVPHILNITRDISERIKIEQELIIAKNKAEESDKLKTAFIHNISHEIRTPMNAIIGFSELLKNEDIISEKKQKYVDIIINSSKQLLSIINDVLEISRIESQTVQIHETIFNINEILEELYQLFLPKIKNIEFKYQVELTRENAFIETDEAKIKQILINLLTNAIKFTNSGQIIFGYFVKNQTIVFYVKDTGIGIPPEEQSKIFDRFYQANRQIAQLKGGSGLGLSICKSLVELLGGNIQFNSVVGKGSEFYIHLPYKPKKNIEKDNSITLHLDNLNIMVVEDIPSNYELVEHLLEAFRVKLYWAQTAHEALQIVRNNNIHLILLDIKLPDVDGITLARMIKEINSKIHIIILSAYTSVEDQNLAFEAGCEAYITKPIDKKNLYTIIQKLSQ